MASENSKIDQNGRWTMTFVTNDANEEIVNARVNPVTGALLVEADILSTNTSIGSTIPGGTEGSVLFLGPGSTLDEDNANFFYDATNHRLGIGTTTPSQKLHIVGSIRMVDGLQSAGFVMVSDANGVGSWQAISATGVQVGIQWQDEGGNLGTSGTATIVNFTGAGVTASRSTNTITVNIPAISGTGYDLIQNNGVSVTQRNTVNLSTLLTAADVAAKTALTINTTNLGNDTTFINTLTGNSTFITNINGAVLPTTTRGDMIVRNATTNVRFPLGASGTVIRSNGTDPVYGKVILTGDVTGILPLANGGTGSNLSDPAANKILAWDDTDNTVGFWTLGSGLSYDHATHTLSATGGGSSPLTTKGDLFTYTSVDARLPVGSNGQILSADSTQATGLKWVSASSFGGGTKLAIDTTTTVVTGTTAETTVYTIPIPGGTLGTNDGIYFDFGANYNNAAGYTIRIYWGGLGGTVISAPATGAESATGTISIKGFIVGNAATNAQKSQADYIIVANTPTFGTSTNATLAIDSTVTQDLVVTVQAANAGDTLTTLGIIVTSVSSSSTADKKKVGVGESDDIQWFNVQYLYNSPTMWTLSGGALQNPTMLALGLGDTAASANLGPDVAAGGVFTFNPLLQAIFQVTAKVSPSGVGGAGLGIEAQGGTRIYDAQGTNDKSIGFVKDGSNTWFTRCADGGGFTENPQTIANGLHTFRCEYDPANATPQVRYYLDGVLIDTITTNVPTNGGNVTFSAGGSISNSCVNFISAPSFSFEQ